LATDGVAVAALEAAVVGLDCVDELVQPATETTNTTTKMPMSVVKKRLSYFMFQLSLETRKTQRPKGLLFSSKIENQELCWNWQNCESRPSISKAADYFEFPSNSAF